MKLSAKISRLVIVSLLACSLGSTPVFAQASSFDDLRREHNAVPIASALQLRADADALAGKVVELQGEVAGLMTRDGAHTVLLKMGDDMTVLAATAETENASLLRAGTLVRLLARVHQGGGFSILIVTANVPSTAARNQKTAPAKDEDGALISPLSATIETLPEAPGDAQFAGAKESNVTVVKGSKVAAFTKTRPAKNAGQLPASKPSAGEVDDLIADQVPAYAAIVRRHNKKLRPEVVQEISVALLRAGYKHNMDPRFLASIIAVESDFDVFCRSHSGAMGLGQMMPFNLKEAGVEDPWNPTQNVMGTAQLLRNLLDKYKNRSNGTLLAVAAYNAGQGAVRRAGYKVPKGAQVQRYVWKVYNRYKAFAPDMFN